MFRKIIRECKQPQTTRCSARGSRDKGAMGRNTYESQQTDSWGNVTINKFNFPGGKADRESQEHDE